MAVGGNSSGGGASGIKAGAAYVELGVKNFLGRDLAAAQKTFQNFGNAIGSIGRKMALGGAAALTPLVGALGTLNDIAKQGSIAKALGLTSEQFTGIAGVAKSVGNDTKEFIESLVTLGKLGTDAAAGTEQASQAFASMGLNANEFIKLRADEQFFTLFDALNKMEDPLQRTRALMMAFGEDGGKILLPLLGKSSEELKSMAAGFAISGDDMKSATAASASYAAATQSVSKAWQSVSVAVAPVVKMIADGFAGAAGPFTNWINQNREVVVGLTLAVGGLTAIGIGLAVLGPAIAALAGGWSLFMGVVAVGKAVIAGTMAIISAPILLIPAALAAAGVAFLAFTETGQSALKSIADTFMSIFGPTIENIKTSFAGVVSAVGRGDLSMAFQLGVGAMRVEWARLTVWMTDFWNRFKGMFLDGWRDLALKFTNIWASAVHGTADLLTDLGEMTGIYDEKEAADIKRIMSEDAIQEKKDRINARIRQQAASDQARAGDLGGAGADLKAAEAAQKQLQVISGFRQVFAMMKGEKAIAGGAGGDLGNQIAAIASASRGGFGGSVSSGMFGGGDGVKQIVGAVQKVEKAVLMMGAGQYMEQQALLFKEGK